MFLIGGGSASAEASWLETCVVPDVVAEVVHGAEVVVVVMFVIVFCLLLWLMYVGSVGK